MMQATCQYLFTEEMLLEAYRMHYRSKLSFWIFKFVRYVVGAAMLFLALIYYPIAVRRNQLDLSAPNMMLDLMLIGFGLWFIWHKHLKERAFVQHVQSHDQYGIPIVWTLSAGRLDCSGEGYQATHVWSQVIKAVEYRKGFLIYLEKHLFYYLPFSGFAEGTNFVFVRKLVPKGMLKSSFPVWLDKKEVEYPKVAAAIRKLLAALAKSFPWIKEKFPRVVEAFSNIPQKYPQIGIEIEKTKQAFHELVTKCSGMLGKKKEKAAVVAPPDLPPPTETALLRAKEIQDHQ